MQDNQRRYWSFFWPLALTGLAMIIAAQFKNGVLARYPTAVAELAVFAIASSIFHVCNAALIFLPQMTNVLARDKQSSSVCLRFVLIAAAVLSLPVLLLGYTQLGPMIVPILFKIDDDWLLRVIFYLQLLAPMVCINALRHYYTGLLIQSKRTGWVTLLNGIMLTTTISVLLAGLFMQGDPVIVISLAHLIPAFLHLVLTYIVFVKRYERPLLETELEAMNYKRLLKFFYPMAITSSMFALSRPVIYHFVSKHAVNAIVVIAVLRVVFDFSHLFFNTLNQTRHVIITFGRDDMLGVRGFMIKVLLVVLSIMLISALTPIHRWFFDHLVGLDDPLHIQMAQEALLVSCLIPMFLIMRNYFHGIAMIAETTGSMGISGVMRIVATFLFVAIMAELGWLDHRTGAAALAVGFMAEAMSMCVLTQWRARKNGCQMEPAT